MATLRALTITAVVGIGAIVSILLFEDRFRDGATLSGLNQQGGPGFLLILLPAIGGWFARSQLTGREVGQVFFGSLIRCSAALGAILLAGGVLVLANFPNSEALLSTTLFAFVVGWLVSCPIELVHAPDEEAQPVRVRK